MEKRKQIGDVLYLVAYAFWLLVAAVRMTRIDDIVTFRYSRLVDVAFYVVVVFMLIKLFLQKVKPKQILIMGLVAVLLYVMGSYISVSKLWAYFWLTFCIGQTSEKKVFWTYFFVHSGLMVVTYSLCRAGILEDIIYNENGRVRHSMGYDYCAYSSHIFTTLTMMYVYLKKKYHWWEGVIILCLAGLFYSITDTNTALILTSFVAISVWVIRRFDLKIPVNLFTRALFQAGPICGGLGMCLLQYFYREDNALFFFLNQKLNHRLILGRNALSTYSFTLFGQKIEWIGNLAMRQNPNQVYNTVDNSFLRISLQNGVVFMVLLLVAIFLLQGRLLKQQNTVLLLETTVFWFYCTLNPSLLSYKSQPFMLLWGYLLLSSSEGMDKSGHGDQRKKEWLKKCFLPLSWLNNLLLKDQKMVLFYSNLGFRDNVRALYEQMIANEDHLRYKIVVSLNDYESFQKKCPKQVRCVSNKVGLFYYLKAGTIFYSFGKYPILPAKNQQIINLWHGMPLKRIGNMEESLKGIKYDYFSKVLATSPFFAKIMGQVFSCEEDRVLICGQPRTDALFRSFSEKQKKELWYAKKETPQEDFETAKKIVWLPTYRQDDDKELFPTLTLEQMPLLDDYLCKMGAVLWIKLHPLQKYDESYLNSLSFKRICVYAQKDVPNTDLYDVLSYADGLITDYSSIYFDYLMLDRPIGFMVGDLSQYKEDRGFVFDDFEAFMPGEKIVDFASLKHFIKDLCEQRDTYQAERQSVSSLTHQYLDGQNANRLLGMVGLRELE